ncbi:hypothetical protein A0H81_07611 [Grifola frondosa]|uniref:Glucose-methanol-choline oxidoreductase N-terminal domain-containing protein n=1 Tax=Grifola frondosa TaxID=5627 RepID=A0A1C7M5I7_GRIFR|nr:hypothetical protein A0H81_07611 [Grifola frondosa]
MMWSSLAEGRLAGESSSKLPFVRIPSAYSQLFHGKHDYDLYTVPQINAGAEAKYWPRAKLLGGCSALNAMIYHYGAPSDYDEWAEFQDSQDGASGWFYKNFNEYFMKYEKYHPSEKFPLVDASLRGSSGPVEVGYFGHISEGTTKFIEACDKAGIAHSSPDVNTHKGSLGATKAMTYISPRGRRVTTESAYLTAAVLARPNLKVATKAQVTRVLFEQVHEAGGPETRAVGVEFTNPNGEKFRVKARKEVVLAAGAIHTPQILMLSGVGPADHLTAHNIPVVADLPGVGSHLMDHVVIDLRYKDKSESSVAFLRGQSFAQRLQLIAALLQYRLKGTGPLASNLAEAISFVRSDDPVLFPREEYPPEQVEEDTTSGPGAPDIELFFTPMAYRQHGQVILLPEHYFALHAVLLRPTSTGTIRLQSADPREPPLIDPEYLSTEHDVAVLVRAARLLTRIVRTEPLASMLDPAGDTDEALDYALGALDDEALAQRVREKAETLYHPACTARMAPLPDGGVVDPLLRVHGIANLRVADASVFPTIVSGHTAAPVIAVAEKAADLIKADFKRDSI